MKEIDLDLSPKGGLLNISAFTSHTSHGQKVFISIRALSTQADTILRDCFVLRNSSDELGRILAWLEIVKDGIQQLIDFLKSCELEADSNAEDTK